MKLIKGFLLEIRGKNEGILLTNQGSFQRVRLYTNATIGEEVYGQLIEVGYNFRGLCLVGFFFLCFFLTQAICNPKATVGAGCAPPPLKIGEDKKIQDNLETKDLKLLVLKDQAPSREYLSLTSYSKIIAGEERVRSLQKTKQLSAAPGLQQGKDPIDLKVKKEKDKKKDSGQSANKKPNYKQFTKKEKHGKYKNKGNKKE
ncbi:MAG TPA: hypothetical protein DDZ91_03365 [Firmicutes bacterium]|jgi:hypothetical protein|nr:hypothetical protein [Bacillota bacterium]